ncbi:MAG: MC/SLC25 family protein, partial [Terriglobus roseus]|nr:MC/SLC25 family protein [Terriglobus roseus]
LGAVWLAGAAGGLASFVVSAPTELVKCRVQVLDRAAGAAGEPAASSWGVAREVVRREGLRGLYFGGAVTSVRDAVGYGFYFWSYELLKQAWTRREESVAGGTVGEADADAALKVLVCGGVAGVVTWASIFPLDVVKTRVQTQAFETPAIAGERQTLLGGASTGAPRRVGAWQVARQAYLNEGFAVFFRGLGVCSVRAFIVNAVQWAVYEWTMQILLKQNQTHQI